MKKRKSKSDIDNSSSPFPKLVYIDVAALTKIALPLSLNDYYRPFISNVQDCLLFLKRFSDSDEAISNLLDVYDNDPAFSKAKVSDNIDLDLLAKKSNLTVGEFRRLINSTLDLLGDEEAVLLLSLNKKHLVSKSLQVALTDQHPDSYQERHSLMQYFGYHPVPKTSAVNINVDKSQNLSLSQTQVGLPSFASTISESEKVASQQIKDLIDLELEKLEQEGLEGEKEQKQLEASTSTSLILELEKEKELVHV